MAKQDESINPRLLAAARKEFCSQGFAKASTNRICAEAGVTTGALFKRYKNKDELFCALVADTAENFKEMLKSQYTSFGELSVKEQRENAVQPKGYQKPMQFIYERLDDFRLLLCSAEGSYYEHYKEEITDIIAEATVSFMRMTESKAMLEGEEVSEEVIRYLIGMQQHALFEIIKKQTDYEQACKHATQVQSFFDLAWAGLFKL